MFILSYSGSVWKSCYHLFFVIAYEPALDKTYKMAYVPNEDSDQPGHLSSLISVFAVHMEKVWVLSYPLSAQQRLRSDWAYAQADLSLCWAHMPFYWFCHALAHTLFILSIQVYMSEQMV